MDILKIDPTRDSPEIILDPSGLLEFKGRSLPEDVTKFYTPVMAWIKEYLKSPQDLSKLVFNLEYFNTASSKVINEILVEFDELEPSSKKVEVLWYYEFDDEDMLDIGREFKDNLEIPIELIPVEVTI